MEVAQVSGGNYEDWQVVAIAGASSGLSVAAIKAFSGLSVLEMGKYFIACSIPTAVVSGLIVGTMYLANMYMSSSSSSVEEEG